MNPIALLLQQMGQQLLQPAGDVVQMPGTVPGASFIPRNPNASGPAAPIVDTIWPGMPDRMGNAGYNQYATALAQQGRK